MALIKPVYLTLTSDGTTPYSASISKTKTPIAVYSIPRALISFRDTNNLETIKIHPNFFYEIKSVLNIVLDSSTADVQATPIFFIENLGKFLINITGCLVKGEPSGTTNISYYAARSLVAFKICDATPVLPTGGTDTSVFGKAVLGAQTMYFIKPAALTSTCAFVLETPDEFADICITIPKAAISTAPTVTFYRTVSSIVKCTAETTNNTGYLKLLYNTEGHTYSYLNSPECSAGGATQKIVRRPTSAGIEERGYLYAPLVIYDGINAKEVTAKLDGFDIPDATKPGGFETSPILPYPSDHPKRMFLAPVCTSDDLQKNNVLGKRDSTPIGTFVFMQKGFDSGINKYIVFNETELATSTYNIYECAYDALWYTKCCGWLSGGAKYSAEQTYSIKLRAGLIITMANLTRLYKTTGAIREANSSMYFSTDSDNTLIGRSIHFKIPDTNTMLYDAYNVIIHFGVVGISTDTTYQVTYEDGSEEYYQVKKGDQTEQNLTWWEVREGKYLVCVANPGIADTDIAQYGTAQELIHGKALGDKLVDNAAGKKLKRVFVYITGGSELATKPIARDLLLGVVLSQKTP